MAPSFSLVAVVLVLVLAAQTLALEMESLYYPSFTKHAAWIVHTKHAYYRPSGASVSGIPGNCAAYHRSPCPGLKTTDISLETARA